MKLPSGFYASLLLLFVLSVNGQIQKNNRSCLTIEKIMRDPGQWLGTSPGMPEWDDKSETIYFSWNPEKDTLTSLYSWNSGSKSLQKVTTLEKSLLPDHSVSYNSSRTQKVFIRNGSLVFADIKKGKEKTLISSLLRISSPRFVLHDSMISFVYEQNLFLMDPEMGSITQVTDFSREEKPEKTSQGQNKWLEDQQMLLFEVFRKKDAYEQTIKNRQKLEETEHPAKIYTEKKKVSGISLSPSGKYLVYSLQSTSPGNNQTSVTHFVTRSGYTENIPARSKVGAGETVVEMGIFDRENNKGVKINIEQIPGLDEKPDYPNMYPQEKDSFLTSEKNRAVSLFGPVWNEENDVAIVVALSADNKDRWILLLDPSAGKLKTLDRQHNDAWIGGPGIDGWGYSTGNTGWMPDGRNVWFHSEESGYSHLYAVDTETGKKRALTQGKFEVSGAFISHDRKYFYFTANKIHPGVKHFYRMPVSGGELIQLTSMEGINETVLSPDGKHLAIRYSYANQPEELYIQQNKPGASAVRITFSTTPEFNAYPWRVPEFLTFPASDGATVYARLYRPADPENQGPAVIFVHGAGYLQNAHKGWSSYSREYMFHNFLVDNGYTVLDIDYRGSAGYGRDWRTGIYRHMGGKDLSDHVDGAKWLSEKYGVSPERIGIYGGSYGGFITLMAMFRYPDVFTAGAALRSVTDWAHYNHGYTSNILNTPVSDSLAFIRSSPIYYAEGLKGALLMCHGMVDDNVHFQDIVRLTQRLIELGKENWELAVYPVESHGFTEPSSWTDEYKRIYRLFEENLKTKNNSEL